MARTSVSRRQAIRQLIMGAGAAATPTWIEALTENALALTQRRPFRGDFDETEWRPRFLTAQQDETVAAISEIIIPETDTGGAKEAFVNVFIDNVLAESDEKDQGEFLKGLGWMDERSRQLFGKDFRQLSDDRQIAIMTIIASDKNRTPGDKIGVEFFKAIKALTITGYYNSDVGIFDELEGGQMHFPDYAGCAHSEHQNRDG